MIFPMDKSENFCKEGGPSRSLSLRNGPHNQHTTDMPTAAKTIPQLTEKDQKRFWSKIIKGTEPECWIWTGTKNKPGYGSMRIGNGMFRANRIVMALSGFYLTPETQVMHDSPNGDNPSCVNPSHLKIGTHLENMQDRERKGRGVVPRGDNHHFRKNPSLAPRGIRNGKYTKPERTPRGERAGKAKLTTEKVIEMRIRHAAGETYSSLGRAFGISKVNANRAINRKTWTHVP